MVTTAALQLEIDARNMKAGAAEAQKALVAIADESKKTARQITVDTSSIERKLDAIVEGMILHNNKLGESNMNLRKIAESVEKTMEKAQAQTRAFGAEVNKTTSIADAVEKKLSALGKAAVGMFAVDIVAKVAGFSSAMDLLNKASQGIADGIGEAVKALRGMDESWEKNVRQAARFQEIVARARADMEGRDLVVKQSYSALGIDVEQSLVPFLGRQEQLNSVSLIVDDTMKKLASLNSQADVYLNPNESTAYNREGYDVGGSDVLQAKVAQIREDARAIYAGMGREIAMAIRQSQIQGTFGGGYGVDLPTGFVSDPQASDIAGMNVLGGSPFARSSMAGALNRYSPDAIYEDVRRRMMAEEAAARRARVVGLNTTRTAMQFGYGVGVPDVSGEYFPITGGEPAPFYERYAPPPEGRNRKDRWLYGENEGRFDGGYIGRLQNRYSAENIAEQFSANLYQSLSYSLSSGDFSQFGRSVVSMIGQSLVDNLIAAPFQEAMATLMQSLLGNLSKGLGAGGAIGQGVNVQGPPEAPTARIQAGAGSNSVAPYRSTNQRMADFQRGRIR